MSTGFKSSFFGFKKSDVLDYIEELHKKHSNSEEEKDRTIEELKKEIDTLKDDVTALNEEKERLANIQEEYIKRYNEVEKLSESIGKLYLEAQTDAKELLNKSEENRTLINREVESHISAIEEMHASLDSIKNEVVSSADSFSKNLDKLFKAFEEAKSKLKTNSDDE